jgi:hypothetical protein
MRLPFLALSLLVGCAAQELSIGRLPPVGDAASGEIVVARPRAFIGEDFPFYLSVDQENIAALEAREHRRFRLAAGEYRIAIRCTHAFKEGWSETAITQRVAAGQTIYLSVTPKSDCASLHVVSESDGKKLLSSTTSRPL